MLPTPFHIIIPARMASTRLPGKMLADLAGVPLVVRTALQAAKSAALSITIAADDPAIVQAAQHGGHGRFKAILTHASHPTGTDRLSEAVKKLGLPDDAIVVNVQGDEPLVDPAIISAVAQTLAAQPDCVIATAAHEINNLADVFNPNVVKVVCNAAQQALYFSRAPIPYDRDAYASDACALAAQMSDDHVSDNRALDNHLSLPTAPSSAEPLPSAHLPSAHLPQAMRHIGIYAYRVSFLRSYPTLARSPLESSESLEQLRALWHGYKIAVLPWAGALAAGVDTPADLARVRSLLASVVG